MPRTAYPNAVADAVSCRTHSGTRRTGRSNLRTGKVFVNRASGLQDLRSNSARCRIAMPAWPVWRSAGIFTELQHRKQQLVKPAQSASFPGCWNLRQMVPARAARLLRFRMSYQLETARMTAIVPLPLKPSKCRCPQNKSAAATTVAPHPHPDSLLGLEGKPPRSISTCRQRCA